MSGDMALNIEHIGLMAKDTEKLAAWYEQVLGLRIIYKNKKEPPTFFVKGAEGPSIEIFPYSQEGAPPAALEDSKFHLAMGVLDLEEIIVALSKKGVIFNGKIKEASGGVRLITIHDPEGNHIQFVQRPVRLE